MAASPRRCPGQSGVPELLAPAGNWECVRAAVANGADAVYFGLPRFNARLRADNFEEKDLPELMRFLHDHGVRGFAAFNTLVFTDELHAAASQLECLAAAGVDAVIVQDIGLARMVRALTPELALHASTQMTITSPEGLGLLHRTIGLDRAVLARELSIRELLRFHAASTPEATSPEECPAAEDTAAPPTFPASLPPLEVFVHGALCVAYSGQCLTSEALGQRSANRGECAQACRLPYSMFVDGKPVDLGGRRHLLSPQDLAAVDLIPDLLDAGIASFKIEGRLKSPEYVAAVTRVYRKALNDALGRRPSSVSARDRYALEMTFSRGLSTGWLGGTDHPRLTHGRFGKKRGPLLGFVVRAGRDWVEADALAVPVQPGDGIVFDTGGDTDREQGGLVFAISGRRITLDRRSGIDTARIPAGARVWKTSDPELERELRRTWKGRSLEPVRQPLELRVSGRAGTPLVVEVPGSAVIRSSSSMPLAPATNRPLTDAVLAEQLGRMGTSRYRLDKLDNAVEGSVMLPLAELNRLRRDVVRQLECRDAPAPTAADESGCGPDPAPPPRPSIDSLLEAVRGQGVVHGTSNSPPLPSAPSEVGTRNPGSASGQSGGQTAARSTPRLSVLCRTVEQAETAIALGGVDVVYLDLEDIRRYADAVSHLRKQVHDGEKQSDADGADKSEPRALHSSPPRIFVATPRIQKAGESGFFKIVERACPDGVLVRNVGGIDWFRAPSPGAVPLVGDFTLNVANPLTAEFFMDQGLEAVTVACDLNADQVEDLLHGAPPAWFELVLHQHMPMFHMEHCAFCAFLSNGHDFTDCGRPCEKHVVELEDRVGQRHLLQADAGCRNTLFRGQAQTGARHFERFLAAGLRRFRVELLRESAAESERILRSYLGLLQGRADGSTLWKELRAESRLGVIEGTLRGKP